MIVPLTLREANAYVAQHHRHHLPARGCKFCIGLKADELVGAAIISRPTARRSDDGLTCEVIRLCTDGRRNACSMLYRAAWRCAKEMGYKRLITYTLPDEGGASLRGAGFKLLGQAGGGSWSRESRQRENKHPQLKLKWEIAA